jgi:glycosyltransferase involved in cell wall biosynthesis
VTTPARILYAHNSADLYGASRSLLRLTAALDPSRFTPVALLPEDGPLRARLEAQDVHTIVEPRLSVITRADYRAGGLLRFTLRFPASVWALARLLRRERIDLVHTNTGVIVSSALAARLAGRPHVWHIRDWFQEFGRVWPLYSAYIRRSSFRVLAVSEAVAAQFADRSRVQVMPNGFELAEFAHVDRAAARRAYREAHGLDGFVVGCVGRVKIGRKGQDVLLQALARLAREGRAATCAIIGAPSPGSEHHLPQLQGMAQELGVADRVLWAGEEPDARLVYPALDVLVLPSAQPEPFAGVVMEAMAMGVPVVATRLGGSVDQVDDGVTGLLVAPGDADDLARALARLMDDPALLGRMAEAAPRRIADRFTMGSMMAALHDVYEHALAR